MITRILWRNYRLTSGLKHGFRRRFTPAGFLVMGTMLLAGGIGMDTTQAMSYQVFTLSSLLLFTGLLWGLLPTPKFEVSRSLPRFGTAGERLIYQLSVRSRRPNPQRGLAVTEDLGDPRPTYAEFLETPEPGEKKRNLFDRFFRFYRWMWLIEQKQMALPSERPVPEVRARDWTTVSMELVPKRRGLLKFAGIRFAIPDPFGLTRRYSKAASPQTVLVLPKRYLLPNFPMPGATAYLPGGNGLATKLGHSQEFAALREYRRGDPMRHIHWRSVGKTGKLIVKEFQSEYFSRQALVLDTFLSQPDTEAFEEAVSIAASFAWTLRTQESLIDLVFVGPHPVISSPRDGEADATRLLEILANVRPCTDRDFAALENEVLRQVGSIAGCVCVLLEWDAPRQRLVRQLQSLAIPVMVLLVLRPGQRPPEPGPVAAACATFRTLEAGRVAEGLASL